MAGKGLYPTAGVDYDPLLRDQHLYYGKRTMSKINAEGSRLMMELFNRMPVEELNKVPGDIAKRIGEFMDANGYRLVFDRWYLQHAPKE